jgi:hypothetical protein
MEEKNDLSEEINNIEKEEKEENIDENYYDDEEIMDRKKQKEKVHPYRKYQITIVFLLILMLSLIWACVNLNKELTFNIKKQKNLQTQLFKEEQKNQELMDLYNRVEVNYVSLYQLDKTPNIETIKTIDELNLLSNFISNEKVQYSLCYKATIDGDNSHIFRDKCSYVSPLLIIIETAEGYRFGGYTSKPISDNEFLKDKNGFINDINAFIFSFDTKKKYNVIKNEEAIWDINTTFPSFGKDDIVIKDGFLSNPVSFINFPNSYEKENEKIGDYILTGGIKKFKIKEMEALFVYL